MQLPATGDTSQLPERWGTVITPLVESDLPRDANAAPAVTGAQAIAAAEKEWSLTDADIDPKIGAVRALLTQGKGRIQEMKVWIAVANVEVMSQGPPQSAHFVTRKLCIVIDASSCQYVYAYTVGSTTYV
jgi:hypothetical protein